MPLSVTWRTSELVDALYAGMMCTHYPHKTPEWLREDFAEPASALRRLLVEENISADPFWDHCLGLAARSWENLEKLAETLVRKLVSAVGPSRPVPYRHAFVQMRNQFAKSANRLRVQGRPSLKPIQDAWNYQGQGILTSIESLLEPGVLVEDALVLGVTPIADGWGWPALSYNVICIEMTEGSTDLPEVLRLAWLLSTLNLDLPRFSELVPRPRRTAIALLAMIAPVLTAGEALRLCKADRPSIRAALAKWMAWDESAADTLAQWWEVYRGMKPSWGAALQGLDQLISSPQP